MHLRNGLRRWRVTVPLAAIVAALVVAATAVAGDTGVSPTPFGTPTGNITDPGQNITAVRVEVLPHEDLPNNGPGRNYGGGFRISEFTALRLPEDADGPPAYKLAKDADVTVMLFVKQKVVANFAFRSGEFNDKAVDAVLKSVPKLFEGTPPKPATDSNAP